MHGHCHETPLLPPPHQITLFLCTRVYVCVCVCKEVHACMRAVVRASVFTPAGIRACLRVLVRARTHVSVLENVYVCMLPVCVMPCLLEL